MAWVLEGHMYLPDHLLPSTHPVQDVEAGNKIVVYDVEGQNADILYTAHLHMTHCHEKL